MKKFINYENIVFFTIFLVAQIFSYFIIQSYYKTFETDISNRIVNSIKNEYNSSRESLIELADSSFEGYINRPEIKAAFFQRDREKLYNLLIGKYQYLKKLGFNQVHFHTPENISFLRMHRPYKFGDDLSKARESVVYVNKNIKKINAIESGRTSPGFRNVYPLFYENRYLGSVELSFDMEKLERHIKKIYSSYAHFLFNKSEFEDIVFDKDKLFYKPSNEHPDFVERDYNETNKHDFYIRNYKFEKKHINLINEGISSKKPFSLELAIGNIHNDYHKHEHYLIVFLPIHDLKTKKSIYFVFYELSEELKNFHTDKIRKHVYFGILIFFLVFIIFLVYRYNTKVSKERTKFESILNNSTDFIHILDKKGNIVLCSQSFADILGYTKEEALKLNIKQWNATKEGQEKDYLKKRMSKENTYQTIHRKKDGTIFPVHATAKPIEFDDKEYYYVSSRDITRLIKYDELKKQKMLFDTVFEASIDGILLLDLKDNKIVSCNQNCANMLKAPSKEEVIKNHPSLFSPELQEDGSSSLEKANEMIEIAKKEGYHTFKWQHKRFDGELFWAEVSLTYLKIDNEDFLYSIWKDIQEEVSNKIEKEKQDAVIMEQSRLAQLGELISMIAHQWRQPLNELTIKIQLMPHIFKKNKLDENYLTDFVSKSKETINYMSETIDNFRNFYTLEKEKKYFDVKNSIFETISLLDGRLVSSRVNLEAYLDDDIMINGYESELKQIILILMNNSLDAIEDIKEKSLILTLLKEEENVVITVKDNGHGIPNEVKPRIFEPYFTTKHSSVGTGIGLYTAKMILERSFEGNLSFESDTKGTTFKIVFPSSKS